MSTNVQTVNPVTNIGQNYAGRIKSIIDQTTQTVKSFSFPTVGEGGQGILGKLTPYFIYGLTAVLVILLILTIVHYTITPIFNFGDQPNALVTIQASDWTKMWDKDSESYYDAIGPVLPKDKYTVVLDVIVLNQIPTTQVGNKYVFFYKTSPASASPQTPPISNFRFLESSQMSVNDYPNLIAVYDALSSKIVIYIKVASTVQGSTQFDIVPMSANIIANTPYRIGLVVGDKMAELYVNGKYASTVLFQGKQIVGSDTDILFGTPMVFQQSVKTKYLFTTKRVVTAGSIRTLGGPALATQPTGLIAQVMGATQSSSDTASCPA